MLSDKVPEQNSVFFVWLNNYAGILLKTPTKTLLIDPVDVKAKSFSQIDAVLITHEHYDHVGGLDDVRPLGQTNIYAEKNVLEAIERNMPYCFGTFKYPGVPKMNLNQIDEQPFEIQGIKITPIRVMHARLPILGYRIGDIAYLTDVKSINEFEFEKIHGLKILVINALRKEEHISHITLGEAIKIAQKINADKTFFSHISHHLGLHNDVSKELPENIYLAYDNLSINF